MYPQEEYLWYRRDSGSVRGRRTIIEARHMCTDGRQASIFVRRVDSITVHRNALLMIDLVYPKLSHLHTLYSSPFTFGK